MRKTADEDRLLDADWVVLPACKTAAPSAAQPLFGRRVLGLSLFQEPVTLLVLAGAGPIVVFEGFKSRRRHLRSSS